MTVFDLRSLNNLKIIKHNQHDKRAKMKKKILIFIRILIF